MKKSPLLACLLLFVSGAAIAQDQVVPHNRNVVEKYRQAASERWEKDIQQLEALDKTESYPDDAVLFIGSSSIRLWKSIAEDMQPFVPIRRGYGGAKFTDLAVFADRLINPHNYQALVVFVANDVTGGTNDTPLEDLVHLVKHVINVGQEHRPDAPVFLIEVTPTSSRFKAFDKIRQVNHMLRDLALTVPGVHFIATAEHYLDEQKKPKDELFVEDRLHLNQDGYKLWSNIIRNSLDQFKSSSSTD